jgi:hypothetical protein
VVELLALEPTVACGEGERHFLVDFDAALLVVWVPVPAVATTIARSEWHSDCNGLQVLPVARSDLAHPRVRDQVSV